MPLNGVPGTRFLPSHQTAARSTITGGPTITTITASGSANTKGSWTQILAATLNKGGTWITLVFGSTAIAGTRTDYLVDIAWGSSKISIIDNMTVGYRGTLGASTAGENYYISVPIFIPDGETVYARCQSDTGSATMKVSAGLFCGQWPGGGVPFQHCETIGADTTNSRGTLVTAKHWLSGPTGVDFTPTIPWRSVFFSIGGYGDTAFSASWITLDAAFGGLIAAMQLGMYVDGAEKIIGPLPNALSPFEYPRDGKVTVKLYADSGITQDLDICAHFLA